jgi:hypothetical protein
MMEGCLVLHGGATLPGKHGSYLALASCRDFRPVLLYANHFSHPSFLCVPVPMIIVVLFEIFLFFGDIF